MKEYKVLIESGGKGVKYSKGYKVTASNPGIASRRSLDHYLRVHLKGKKKPKEFDVKIICGSITIKVPVSKIKKPEKMDVHKESKKNRGEGITVLGDIYEYGTNKSVLSVEL